MALGTVILMSPWAYMTFYHPNQRKVYGTEQLPDGYELLTTTEYARKFSYTRDAVAKKCRRKKLRAYKDCGNWYVLSPKQS